MKKRILIICALAFLFCVFLILHQSVKQQKKDEEAIKAARIDQQSAGQTGNVSSAIVPARVDALMESNGAANTLSQSIEESNARIQQVLALWQKPIDFYGEVLDENSNAVENADIQFRWIETPEAEGEKTASTKSDSMGLFSLRGKIGRSLTVWVNKEGYYVSHGGQESFVYAIGPTIFSPDPQNPVIFRLKKKGTPEPLIRLAGTMGGARDYRLNVNGTPTELSIYTGKRTSHEESQFRVEYKMEAPEDSGQRQFAWRCKITVPGGGLQIATEEFPFTAPTDGYQEMIEINSELKPEAWTDRFKQAYYVRLADGKYGWLKFDLVCNGNPFFGVEALVNPTGSRNLEYDKYLSGNIMVGQSSP